MQYSWAKSCAATQSRADRHKKKLSDRSPRRRARRLPAPAGGARILKGEAYAAGGVYVVGRRTARRRQCSSPTLLRVSLAKTLG